MAEDLRSITLGQVPGERRMAVLGNNPNIDVATTPEFVWSGGGIYPWMTGATNLEMVCTNANDIAGGTGARAVSWNLLDTAYGEFTQVFPTNGLTPVPLTLPAFRVNGGLVVGTAGGVGTTNLGDIILRDAGGGTTRAIIPAGYGITRQCVFTVPAGNTLIIESHLFSLNRQGGVVRFATFSNYIQGPTGIYRMPLELSISDNTPYRHDGLIRVNEKTDYAVRVNVVSNNATDVTAAFLGTLTSMVHQ